MSENNDDLDESENESERNLIKEEILGGVLERKNKLLNEQLLQSNLDAKLALIRSRKRRSESGLNDKDLHLEFVLRFFELKEKKKDEKLKKLEEDLRRAEIKLNSFKK
ncbi:hypothetical protein MHBO_003151 [Bonamia ostreae]|uniref:Uncharacterized protein n=1 Tax=Bonamia ostreae TaxID=126728 RepID=A0ABV2AQ07_9EUKA